jgi:LEA14-like dessication related protein
MRSHCSRIYLVAAFILATRLAGCAGLGKRLESPRVSLVHLEVAEAKLFETVFHIELRVLNTNSIPLAVKGVDCKLVVNGEDFAQGVSDAQVEIPAYGTAKIPMVVYSALMDMVKGVLGAQAQENLKYRISGRLRLEGGALVPSVIPFSTDGELALGEPGGTGK